MSGWRHRLRERLPAGIFRGRRIHVWYHPAFRIPFPSSALHGMDPRRADSVLTWLLDRRIVAESGVHEAPEAAWADLCRAHEVGWLQRLDEAEVVASVCGLPAADVPVASIVELWRRGVGGAIEATRAALRGERVATLMGGFHHAAPDRGAGFCALNDLAVAIAVARAEGLVGRVVVIDLDAHPPDGLAAFALPNVEIRSVSVASGWEAGPGVLDVRVPLGAVDGPYLEAVDRALDGLERPSLAYYLAGSDPLAGDPFGALGVSPEGLRERDRRVFAALEGIPTVVVPGGGYLPRSWTVLAGTLAELARRPDVVPDDYDPVARRVGRVARTFAPFDADSLLLTEEDLGLAFGGSRQKRFLDHYTRHGVELALTRYGVFDALRRMGFDDPRVELDARSSPERMKVLAGWKGERHVLLDLQLAVRPVHHWPTLFIEWMELRDPRPMQKERSSLPGQQRPGLGLAREVGSILLVAAQRLKLAGVSFVPSHYHVAWMARDRAVFADPELRGTFQALQVFLEGVPLHAASARLSAEGLPTEDGAPVTWSPGLMVHALDPALKAWIEEGEPRARAAKRGLLHRLLPAHVTFGA